MAVEQVGPGLGPLEDPALLLLDHLPVVVGQHVPGGVGGQLHHPHPHVGIVYGQVVRHAPHDEQVDALLLQLPGQDPAGPSEAVLRLVHSDHHLTVRGEHLSFMET